MTNPITDGVGRFDKNGPHSFYDREGAEAPQSPSYSPQPARGRDVVGPRTMGGLLANAFLGALPADDFERVLPALEPVALSARENLPDSADARHVYFPETSVVSRLVVFEDGGTVEAAMTGRDGVVGMGAVFGHHAPTHLSRVTVPGSALRMRADLFRQEFQASDAFRRQVFTCAARHTAQVTQRGACVSRHRVEQRLAVWLLLLHDRVGGDDLPLTQELIARRIGTRRAGISEFAGKFQEQGLISYSRGMVRVRDRQALEAVACECYGLMREHA
ncbi:MAG TPA: Crp/Fnr family transcriptional regulator [Pyrinomonadaceae bacterium]|nr:Crp/Fnr family transcriptional regulator [Pyrinomonadaceae bacterium]